MPSISENAIPHELTVCGICLDLSEIETPAAKICLQCKHFYCEAHTSTVDPDYCDNCVRPSAIATESVKLVDEDGVGHTGRGIKLTGEFWAAMQQDVRDMTDSELESHVVSLQQAVREIELIRDYRKIALAHGENELECRKNGKLVRLRLLDKERNGKLSIGYVKEKLRKRSAAPKSAVDSVMATLKSCGLTAEQIISILANAKGGK
jgi:hypothetical protein